MQKHTDTAFTEKTLGQARDIRLIRRLYPFIRPYRLLLLATVFFMICITGFELAIPYATKIAIDTYIVPGYRQEDRQSENKERRLEIDLSDPDIKSIVAAYPGKFQVSGETARIDYKSLSELPPDTVSRLRRSDMTGIGYIAAVLLVIVLLNFVFSFIQVMMMEYIGQQVMHDLRMKLFSHIQALCVRFFTHNPVGRLVTRVTNDIQNMHEMLTSVIIFVMKDLFLVAGITIMLFLIDWQLSLVVYAIFPFVFYAAAKFAGAAREAFRTLRIKIAEINSHFSETIGGMSVIQLFRRESANYDAFEKLNHEYFSAGMQQITMFAIFMPFIELASSVVLAVVIFYGGGSLLAERITLGTLVVFISYLRMFFRPIRDIAEKYNITLNALSSAERIFLILGENDRLPEPTPEERLYMPEKITDITLDHVTFSYVTEEPVLKDISLNIRGGETIAVVGPTGAGKTSLINLLTRFYDPDAGAVRINGTDIRNFRISELRSKIALVLQDPFLFSATIRNNIFPDQPDVGKERIEAILANANCLRLVHGLPHGLDTEVSEGGISLSSGQRQLISIARALAQDPELIIFDEATSYIDSETEQEIQIALMNLMKSRTAIIIAHRLSTARIADRIIVVNHGRIIEAGSHAALIKQNGFYHRLYQLQG